jgi:hypothetical protein
LNLHDCGADGMSLECGRIHDHYLNGSVDDQATGLGWEGCCDPVRRPAKVAFDVCGVTHLEEVLGVVTYGRRRGRRQKCQKCHWERRLWPRVLRRRPREGQRKTIWKVRAGGPLRPSGSRRCLLVVAREWHERSLIFSALRPDRGPVGASSQVRAEGKGFEPLRSLHP